MVFVSQKEGAKIMGIDSGGGDGKSRFEKGIENRGKKRPNRQETIVKMQVLLISFFNTNMMKNTSPERITRMA